MVSPPKILGVRLDERARKAVDDAILKWPHADVAWDTLEWTLAHDPMVGARLFESGEVRAFVFRGAVSVGWPDIRVIYSASAVEITVHDATFTEAKTGVAGHA